MEGIRRKFSAVFLFCVWTVITDLSTAHQGHVIVTKQSVLQVPENKNDHRCMALLRRTIVRKELITYPCFHPVPGVVPVVAHQTQMGLVCRGYTNTPSTQYIRLPTCCPGYQPDASGRCTQKLEQVSHMSTDMNIKPIQDPPQKPYKSLEDLEPYPASYEKKRQQVLQQAMSQPQHWAPHPMLMRRIDAILKQRAHFIRQLQNDMTKGVQPSSAQKSMINGLFSNRVHPLLGKKHHHSQKTVPQIPSHHANHMPWKHQTPVQTMPHAFHKELHKHNIPHTHDKQGNPQLHELNDNTKDAFIKQHQMQMAATNQLNMKRQQELLELQQQKQHALAMRQQMLQHRRMQQAQAQRHQQMMMEQARQAAAQSFKQIPHVPRQQETPRQSVSTKPFVIQRHFVSRNKAFPNIPEMQASVMVAVGPNMMQHFYQQTSVQSIPRIPSHQMRYPGVQLPRIPVETPPVSIRPGPNSPFTGLPPPPLCFQKYLTVVKKCFLDAEIQIPSDHNMFNINFNYNGVCRKREAIMHCIFNNLMPCKTRREFMMVKATIGHTVDELNRVCQIGQINGIEERLGGKNIGPRVPAIPDPTVNSMDNIEEMPVQELPIIPEVAPVNELPIIQEDHHSMSLGQHNVIAQQHSSEILPQMNVEPEIQPKMPEAPHPEPVQEQPTELISTNKENTNVEGTAHAHHNDDHSHEHDIHMMELKEEEYYLPILIGTAIGVAGIFILLLAIVCICCKRRLKKKVYLQKETEKPKLFDVYTIGVPPPVYEVNGIPPISYEEAKGEKFTGSPTSVRRNNTENEYVQQEAGRVSGTVSDI